MRILIQGAGPAGLTLALALHRRGIAAKVVERAQRGRMDGYVVALRHNGLRAARVLGLEGAMQAAKIPLGAARYRREDGRPFVAFDYAKLTAAGGMIAILRKDIMAVLEGAAAGLDIVYEKSISTLNQRENAVAVTFDDGTDEEFDAVIGADGYRSDTRKIVFGADGVGVEELGYRIAAWRFRPDKPLAYSASGISEVQRQATIYQLADGTAETLLCWKDDDVSRHDAAQKQATVAKYFGSCPDPIKAAIESCPDWGTSFADTMAIVNLPAWHRGRVALLGDAAWSLALISGEGPSTAMVGALVLAEELTTQSDVAAAFVHYERRLRPQIAQVQRMARRVAGQFVPASAMGMAAQKALLPVMTSRLLLPRVVKRSQAPAVAFQDTLPGE